MAQIAWFEDRYTNITVQSGGSLGDNGGESGYGVRRLLPQLWAEASAEEQESHATLPSFALNRKFRLVDVGEAWDGTVRLVVRLPVRYRYTFRGRPLEPRQAPVRDAAPRQFFQRVEVDGEVSTRLYRVGPDGQTLTVPGSVQSLSLRRAGARQGRWEAARVSAQSSWEPHWAEHGADDLYTINGDQEVQPGLQEVESVLQLPVDNLEIAFGVELALNGLTLWVKQSGFKGTVRGGMGTTAAGFQVDLIPVLSTPAG